MTDAEKEFRKRIGTLLLWELLKDPQHQGDRNILVETCEQMTGDVTDEEYDRVTQEAIEAIKTISQDAELPDSEEAARRRENDKL